MKSNGSLNPALFTDNQTGEIEMKKIFGAFMTAAVAVFCGCTAVDSANRADVGEVAREGTVVFTRPARFTPFFGNYSISQFVEIVYERASRNSAGQLVVEVGIRNRGPVSWTNWHVNAPRRLTLKSRANFYRGGINTPMVYSTNTQVIVIGRGETFAYKVVCPNPEADAYQIVLGD